MGIIVEKHSDEKGMIWPESVAPYQIHLVGLNLDDTDVLKKAEDLYKTLSEKHIEVLFDDRGDLSAGEKFADCDLIGIPYRVVVSKKTTEKFEVKKRDEKDSRLLSLDEIVKLS